MASVKIIPAMPQAGKTGSSVKEKPRLRLQHTAAYPLTPRNRPPATKPRLSTTPNTSAEIRNGRLQASMPMTAFPAPIPKTESSSTA